MTTVQKLASGVEPPSRPPLATGLTGVIAVGAALLSAVATFAVLTGLTPLNSDSVVVILLGVNAVAVLLLLAIIGREVWHIVQARRRGRAAARLHVQIAGLFSVIAVLPALLAAVG